MAKRKKKNNLWSFIFVIALAIVLALISTNTDIKNNKENISDENDNVIWETNEIPIKTDISNVSGIINLDNIPEYNGVAFIEINNGIPEFTEEEKTNYDYQKLSELDSLGRCGIAFANISKSMMPTEERGSIGSVKPSGWVQARYDDLITDKYLYNRCHLIGYQLTGENANELNLITGTRYLNIEGMLPFENMVADYIKETGNHVAYRVTPVFKNNELVARGVQMEALSIEDNGEGISFNVYCYNVQPGVEIDYLTGESKIKDGN